MTRLWWDNEEIVRGFRDWLTQTANEIEALDEVNDPTRTDAPPTQDAWLPTDDDTTVSDVPRIAKQVEPDADLQDQPAAELPDVGLLQLVEAFTALRHELKLQTKGTRNLEASVTQSLEGLDAASRTFQSVRANEREAADRATRPMVESLIDLDEGLLRAVQAFQATHRQMTRLAPARLRESLDSQFQSQSWWRRLAARRWHGKVREAASEALARSTTDEFASLMQGLELIQTRLERTMRQFDIARLDESGGQVDPSRMTVVELVVDAPHVPAESVVEVVRPGYTWGERVVRFAEVRAVASRPTQLNYDASQWDDQEAGNGATGEKTVR